MTLVPRRCLIVYDEDITDTILFGELIELTVRGDPNPVIGVLYDVDQDEIWVDTSKGYGEHYRGVFAHDVIAISRREWDPVDLKER